MTDKQAAINEVERTAMVERILRQSIVDAEKQRQEAMKAAARAGVDANEIAEAYERGAGV